VQERLGEQIADGLLDLVDARGVAAARPPQELRVARRRRLRLSGRRQADSLIHMDDARARELLQAERERIERALAGRSHQDDGEPADEFDPANLASDLTQDELDEGLGDDLRGQLAAVERAEQRLAAGTYGLSIESGEPIPDDRLEALPAAERTAEEERRR